MCDYDVMNREQLLQELHRKDQLLAEEMSNRETRLTLFVQNAPTKVAIFDREMRYLAASRLWAQGLNRRHEELTGLSHYAEFPEIPEKWKEAHRRGLNGEVVSGAGERFIRSDGNVHWVRWSLQPWYEDKSTIGGIIIFSEELTELKESEEALKKSERRYRDIVENQTEFVDRYLPDGTLTFVNNALANFFGLPPEQLIGKCLFDFIHPDDRDHVVNTIGSLSADNPMAVVENRALLPDGMHLQQWKNIALTDETGKIVEYQGTGRDITLQKQLQDELKQANELLEHRVKERTTELEAAIREQESFSYSVSHDLRAPLRHINSYSALIVEEHGEELSAQARDYLQRIRTSTNRMGDLIDHLLELSRVTRTELRPVRVDLSLLVHSTLRMLEEIEPSRRIERQVQEGIKVKGDRNLLGQLILNLLGNAWKYTSSEAQPRIEFGRNLVSGKQTLFVRDNGVGFDMRYKAKLFRPFERLHGAEFEGVGIGLATAQKIVRRHGGAIWAEGEPGKGATFYFTIAS